MRAESVISSRLSQAAQHVGLDPLRHAFRALEPGFVEQVRTLTPTYVSFEDPSRSRLTTRFRGGAHRGERTVFSRGDTTLVAWQDADPEACLARLAEGWGEGPQGCGSA